MLVWKNIVGPAVVSPPSILTFGAQLWRIQQLPTSKSLHQLARPLTMATTLSNSPFLHEIWRFTPPKRWWCHNAIASLSIRPEGCPGNSHLLQAFAGPQRSLSHHHDQSLRNEHPSYIPSVSRGGIHAEVGSLSPRNHGVFPSSKKGRGDAAMEFVARSFHSQAHPGDRLEDSREGNDAADHGGIGTGEADKWPFFEEDGEESGSDVDMADGPFRHFVLGALGEDLEDGSGKKTRSSSMAAKLRSENKWWRNREHYRPRNVVLKRDEVDKYKVPQQALGGWKAGQKPSFPYEDRFQMGDGKELSSLEVAALLRPLLIDPRQAAIERAVLGRTYAVTPVIEGLVDLGNIAAVSRTAEAMGCQQMHIICNSSFSKYKKHRQVAKGADKWLDIEVWEDSRECLSALKANGYRLAVTHLSADTVPIHEIDWTIPTAIILGNEKWGVSDVALEMSDLRCSIPMGGFVESFNISVAAGIILYQMVRDRVARQGFHGDLSEKERDILRAEFYLRHSRQTQDVIARYFEAKEAGEKGGDGNFRRTQNGDDRGFKGMLRGELSAGIDLPWYLQDPKKALT